MRCSTNASYSNHQSDSRKNMREFGKPESSARPKDNEPYCGKNPRQWERHSRHSLISLRVEGLRPDVLDPERGRTAVSGLTLSSKPWRLENPLPASGLLPPHAESAAKGNSADLLGLRTSECGLETQTRSLACFYSFWLFPGSKQESEYLFSD
jgi:hypothetical protein